jgi:hypothetical protein
MLSARVPGAEEALHALCDRNVVPHFDRLHQRPAEENVEFLLRLDMNITGLSACCDFAQYRI